MFVSASREPLPAQVSFLLSQLNALLHDDVYDRNLNVVGKNYKLNK